MVDLWICPSADAEKDGAQVGGTFSSSQMGRNNKGTTVRMCHLGASNPPPSLLETPHVAVLNCHHFIVELRFCNNTINDKSWHRVGAAPLLLALIRPPPHWNDNHETGINHFDQPGESFLPLFSSLPVSQSAKKRLG